MWIMLNVNINLFSLFNLVLLNHWSFSEHQLLVLNYYKLFANFLIKYKFIKQVAFWRKLKGLKWIKVDNHYFLRRASITSIATSVRFYPSALLLMQPTLTAQLATALVVVMIKGFPKRQFVQHVWSTFYPHWSLHLNKIVSHPLVDLHFLY